MQTCTLPICCLNLSKTAVIWRLTTSSSSKDGAPAHTSRVAQDWLEQHCPDFIKKDEWPPNSPDLNPLDFHVWGAMLARYQACKPKPKNKAELKTVLQAIWDDLPQEPIDRAIVSFRSRLLACIRAQGGHFEHLL